MLTTVLTTVIEGIFIEQEERNSIFENLFKTLTFYYLVSYFFGLLKHFEKDKMNLATRKENITFADLVCDMPGTGDSRQRSQICIKLLPTDSE